MADIRQLTTKPVNTIFSVNFRVVSSEADIRRPICGFCNDNTINQLKAELLTYLCRRLLLPGRAATLDQQTPLNSSLLSETELKGINILSFICFRNKD